MARGSDDNHNNNQHVNGNSTIVPLGRIRRPKETILPPPLDRPRGRMTLVTAPPNEAPEGAPPAPAPPPDGPPSAPRAVHPPPRRPPARTTQPQIAAPKAPPRPKAPPPKAPLPVRPPLRSTIPPARDRRSFTETIPGMAPFPLPAPPPRAQLPSTVRRRATTRLGPGPWLDPPDAGRRPPRPDAPPAPRKAMPALTDWVLEAPTPPRGSRHPQPACAAAEDEPVTQRRGTEIQKASVSVAPPALRALDAPTLSPPMGETIAPPRHAWRAALVALGTVFGVGVVLGAYNLILLQSERARGTSLTLNTLAPAESPSPAADTPAPSRRLHVDLATAKTKRRAIETMTGVLTEAASGCLRGSTPSTMAFVVRRGDAGHLESVAVTSGLDPAARRCLTDALRTIEVAPSPLAGEPWSVTVPLRR